MALDHMTMMFTVLVQDSSGCHERIGQVVLSTAAGDGPEFDHWSQVICNPHCPIDQWHMIHEQFICNLYKNVGINYQELH